MNQIRKAQRFRDMHQGDGAFLLGNCWDAASAAMLVRAGFQALATASAAIAWSRGVADGENLSRDEMLSIVPYITRSVDLPVSVDIEKGYGDTPDDVGATVAAVIDAGGIGVNIEDSLPGGGQREVADMQSRLAAARQAATASGVPLVINARVDAYLLGGSGDSVLSDTIARGNAWIDAGADCVFVPGVVSESVIRPLAESIRGPVNVLVMGPDTPSPGALASWGVRRISLGPRLMQSTLGHLEHIARQAVAGGSFAWLADAPAAADINGALGGRH